MAHLPKTETILAEWADTQRPEFGMHVSAQPKTSAPGLMIGEVPYDPVRHLPTDILPFSIMAEALNDDAMPEDEDEQLYVGLVLPQQPLDISVILHQEPVDDHPGIIAAKHKLAQNIFGSISESLPGMTDRLHTYIIGEGERLAYDTEVIAPGNTSSETATTVSKLCMSGLAFVVSDFRDLPLHNSTPQHFPSTVAVKVNHPYEIGNIPPNRGVLSLSGKRELNTDKPKMLAAYNADKQAQHQVRIERLQQVGIAVAQVALEYGKAQGLGFDVAVADRAITSALQTVTPC